MSDERKDASIIDAFEASTGSDDPKVWVASFHRELAARGLEFRPRPMTATPESLPVTEAARIRDEMIGVARSLADRAWGASQSEMRQAQIEYLAEAIDRITATRDLEAQLAEARAEVERYRTALQSIAAAKSADTKGGEK